MRNILQRRVLFGFLLCVLLAPLTDAQQASPSIAGDYAGVLGNLHVVLHLQQDPAGSLTATLDSIDQGAKDLSCAHVALSGRQLSFDIPVVHGSYKGEASMDGKTITGTWNQGSPQTLNFTRQATVSAPATEMATRNTFEFAGNTRTFYTFLPKAEDPLPLLLLLHGSGRNGQVMVDAWAALAAREHFIVAAPDAFDPAFWQFKLDPPDFLHAVVDQVEAKHAVDRNRIYLFGHSAGAEYALILAIIDSHYFAAIALHAGAFMTDHAKLFSYAGRRMPIAIWVGDQDPLFPLDSVTATKKEFEANGFPIILSVIPNHDHNYYAISNEINAGAWDFLKKTQLGQPDLLEQH
ncbi:MAG: PHB depolymerase family esterase [Terracidiphilus sp.]|jgi:predicted esterase